MRIVIALILLLVTQCENSESINQEQDRKALDALRKEIIEMTEQSVCSEEFICKSIGLGAKPCGGVWGYITYSTSIHEEDLLTKVERYNQLEKKFNVKYGIISDCMMVMPPDDVICEDGKCKAIYEY